MVSNTSAAKEEDYDVVKTSGYPGGHATEASDGTMAVGSGWHQLWTGARAVRASPVNANYFKLMGRAADGVTPTGDPVVLDAVNLADYLLVLFYMGGNDGPVSDYVGASNNWFGVRNRTGATGSASSSTTLNNHSAWKAVTTRGSAVDRLIRPWSNSVAGVNDYTRSNPEFIHEDLAWNAEYRVLFGDRAHRHFFNNGAMTDSQGAGPHAGPGSADRYRDLGGVGAVGGFGAGAAFCQAGLAGGKSAALPDSSPVAPTQSGGTGRVNELLRQLRGYDGGTKPLYPLVNAPVFSQHGGGIPAAGTTVTVSQNNTGSP